jgi:hypothetical protein
MVAAAPATPFKNSVSAMAANAMDATIFSGSSRVKFIAVVLVSPLSIDRLNIFESCFLQTEPKMLALLLGLPTSFRVNIIFEFGWSNIWFFIDNERNLNSDHTS